MCNFWHDLKLVKGGQCLAEIEEVVLPGKIYYLVSEWLLFNVKWEIFSPAISWWEKITFQWDDDDVHFVLDQHAYLDY
jgi:hypothetical protein